MRVGRAVGAWGVASGGVGEPKGQRGGGRVANLSLTHTHARTHTHTHT